MVNGRSWIAMALALAACGGGKGTGDVPVAGDLGTRVDLPDPGSGDPGIDGGRDLAVDPGTTDPGADPAADGEGADPAADGEGADPAADGEGADPAADGEGADAAGDLTPADRPPAQDSAGTDPGMTDPGALDPGAADPGAADPGTADLDSGDVDGGTPGPEPWVQCQDDAPCKALFGEAATCNRLFPGGQCMGCDPEAPGVHVKCTQLSRREDITLSCRFANGGVCLYDCPCPTWLRCLESESLCVLKPCSQDSECLPFQCLEIGDPGSNRYCLPPR